LIQNNFDTNNYMPEITKPQSNNKPATIIVAGLIGLIVGFLYLGFEWLVNNGTNWLWNDVVESDEYRWRVVPLAIIMSLVLSAMIIVLHKKRVLKPSSDLLGELEDVQKTTINDIVVVLIIGALSLIAGASLGPEASLVAASTGVAAWFGGRLNVLKQPTAFVLSIASVGALLAAFFNSLLPVLIPLLVLKQKGKLSKGPAIITLVAGVSAWAVVRVIKNEAYIELPVSGVFNLENVSLAALLGFLSVALVLAIKWTIHTLVEPIKKIDSQLPWLVSAAIFGLVLGAIYFAGGQTIQFSGSEGLKLLGENPAQYSALALLGLVFAKVLATSWSTTSGYRGGLVFPSIYAGVCLSLAVTAIFGLSGSTEAGTIIGSVTGALMSMINPVVGIVLALAMFPISLVSLIVAAAVGSFIAIKFFKQLESSKKS
jgi:H+/Cl- antiporter ClcA